MSMSQQFLCLLSPGHFQTNSANQELWPYNGGTIGSIRGVGPSCLPSLFPACLPPLHFPSFTHGRPHYHYHNIYLSIHLSPFPPPFYSTLPPPLRWRRRWSLKLRAKSYRKHQLHASEQARAARHRQPSRQRTINRDEWPCHSARQKKMPGIHAGTQPGSEVMVSLLYAHLPVQPCSYVLKLG